MISKEEKVIVNVPMKVIQNDAEDCFSSSLCPPLGIMLWPKTRYNNLRCEEMREDAAAFMIKETLRPINN